MKIAILLFTYNRSDKTEKVINSLKENTKLPEKLIVFQDGLKQICKNDISEWKKVNSIIQSIDWCDKEIIVSEHNKGLAESIVSGINYAFEKYDAVVVLEDDCITAPDFVKFMEQCFKKYIRDKTIYSVSGYAWPIIMEEDQYDIYGCGRTSSWGWGTWKDRWELYKKDYELIKYMKRDKIKSKNLAMWGKDLEQTIIGNASGETDSWAVFWALNVIFRGGICINPYKSLVKNIGTDGSGVHCGITDRFDVPIFDDVEKEYNLPDKVVLKNETARAFASLYGSYTAVSGEDESKEKILVYGLGKFYFQSEKDINEKYNILAFVDKRKQGWYAGKKIVTINEIREYDFDKIIVMVMSIQECINIAKNLIINHVNIGKIILGHDLFGIYNKTIERISVKKDSRGEMKLELVIDKIKINVTSEDEFHNVYEVLAEKQYRYWLGNDKKDIIIDVGMNIGDSVLFFLNNKRVEKVYAYEPFKDTYLCAVDNLKSYLQNTNRIEIFQYGISNENAIRRIGFNKDMSCGQSSVANIREDAYEWYKKIKLVQSENEKKETIKVKAASEVFLPIIKSHPECNMILKLDCEGEEYGIIEELSKKGILNRFSLIILEWHYYGKDCILQFLQDAGLSYWCNDKNERMGLIYAFR